MGCQYSAHHAPQCANWYRERASPKQRVAIMSMGFRGWEGLGLPVQDGAAHTPLCAADIVAPTAQMSVCGKEGLTRQTHARKATETTECFARNQLTTNGHVCQTASRVPALKKVKPFDPGTFYSLMNVLACGCTRQGPLHRCHRRYSTRG